MTSPFLLARKPDEGVKPVETGQTQRRQTTVSPALQTVTPGEVDRRPVWQQKVENQQQTTSLAQQNNLITPQASALGNNATNIFPIVKAIGDTALAGQSAATEVRNVRNTRIAQARIQAANDKAIQEAYRRSAAIQTGAAGPTQNIAGNPTYAGNVQWDGSEAAVADMMRKAGFKENELGVGLGIIKAESSFRADATHPNTTGKYAGTVDQGIAQINTMHKGESWYPQNPFDPQQSINAMYALFNRAGRKWTDWTTYNQGLANARPVPATRLQVTAAPTLSGGVYATGNGTLRNAVVNRAMVVQNLPYVWGGTSLSSGVDCSGLVYAVYKELGVPIPGRETANDYAQEGAVGHRVGSVSQLKPGDLIAFQWSGGYRGSSAASHIAIYAGNGQIIEAYGGDHGRRRALTNSSEDRGAIYLSVRFPGE